MLSIIFSRWKTHVSKKKFPRCQQFYASFFLPGHLSFFLAQSNDPILYLPGMPPDILRLCLRLPQNFKRFCAKTSIESSSIQYENDDLMRVTHGDDYTIACCVSSMRIGKEMQFFGARANLAKCLLYAINGGVDEISGKQVGPEYRPITSEYLDYDEVMHKYKQMMKWLAQVYVNALNIIHYMHDKYCYEKLQMALPPASRACPLSPIHSQRSNMPRSRRSGMNAALSLIMKSRATSRNTAMTTTASMRLPARSSIPS